MSVHKLIKIAICDDSVGFVEQAASYCRKLLEEHNTNYNITPFTSPLKLIHTNEPFDIIFLDIEMPEIDGLSAARQIMKKAPRTKIIFLTSHEEHVRKAFVLKAFRYLIKPCPESEFREALSSALTELIAVKTAVTDREGVTHYLSIDEIYYIESLGEGAAVCLENKLLIHGKTLKAWESLFPEYLIRTHKSYLVNLSFIIS